MNKRTVFVAAIDDLGLERRHFTSLSFLPAARITFGVRAVSV
jgi:hypothetical protein